MVKRITVFILFSSLLAVSMYGCGKNEPGNPQVSNQSGEQDFAKIHKDVNFNKEDKEKMHGVGMETEGGGHGMGVHGKKEKPNPNKVIATVNNEKILRKDLDKILTEDFFVINRCNILVGVGFFFLAMNSHTMSTAFGFHSHPMHLFLVFFVEVDIFVYLCKILFARLVTYLRVTRFIFPTGIHGHCKQT